MTKISNLSSPDSFFFKLKMHQNPFLDRVSAPDPAGGAYDAPPRPRSRLGGYPSPLDAFGVSNSAPTAPRFSSRLNTKSWLRQCFLPSTLGRSWCPFP